MSGDQNSGISSMLRCLLYSHDGLGLGHTRRNLALAAALTQLNSDVRVLLATGVEEIHELGVPDNVDTLKLPRLHKDATGGYVARRLGIAPSEIHHLRSALLKAAVESFHPSILVVDKHPVGASGELREGLKALRQQGGHAVLGLRDILDDGKTVMKEWAEHDLVNQIATLYDLVLIYGHPWLFDATREYRLPADVVAKSRFCGYVVTPENSSNAHLAEQLPKSFSESNRSRPIVLATVGGGEDGFFLLQSFLRACHGMPWQGVAVAGPMVPRAESKALQRMAAEADVQLFRFVPGLSNLFRSFDALVCMGGYNTLAEALRKGMPTVCVPRVTPRREQFIRASCFANAGLLELLPPSEMNVKSLQAKIAGALSSNRAKLIEKVESTLRLDGAKQAAAHILALATGHQSFREEVLVQ